ncbi:hypothetical protein B4168_2719 [Anoxybacillus flavithermus]|nr:hypothetical protein B4168_2719 [Anoxybacillus flavithermus]OAO87485.1 hypothetical protein GT23_1134 [Parageobacillus thermoglucosidasius]
MLVRLFNELFRCYTRHSLCQSAIPQQAVLVPLPYHFD